MADQLGLNLPATTALGRGDFLVAPSNALAMALIDTWPDWSAGKLVITGPQGSGKTHLANIWSERTGARVIDASLIETVDIPELASGPVVIEDVTNIAGNPEIETALFHLHNLALANGHTLLFTGRAPLASWQIALPDLKSRLQGAAIAEVSLPDDTLLSAVLGKLFGDRQIVPHADVIPYLVGRMDRSFVAAEDIVDRLDRASIASKSAITRPFVAQILDCPSD